MCKGLRRSKRQRIEKSFGDDFYTYLVEDDPLSFSKVLVLYMQTFGNKPLRLKLILSRRTTHGLSRFT